MNSRVWQAPLALLVGIGIVYGAQVAHFGPILPDRLATHFNAAGTADGWMAKDAFIRFFGGTLLGMWALMCGLAFLLPFIPRDLVNLPHKDYWLAPERAAASYAYLSCYMTLIAASTEALLLWLAQATFAANLLPEPRLSPTAQAVPFAFLGFIFVATFGLLRRFAKPGTDAEQ